MKIFNHFKCRRNLVNIAGNTHHVYNRFAFRHEILFKIAPAHISHNRNFHIRNIIADYAANIRLIAKLPFAEFINIKQIFGGTITEFHIIHAAFNIRFIKLGNKFIRKFKIVAKAAVSDCGVNHLNIGAHGHHITFSGCHNILSCSQ